MSETIKVITRHKGAAKKKENKEEIKGKRTDKREGKQTKEIDSLEREMGVKYSSFNIMTRAIIKKKI